MNPFLEIPIGKDDEDKVITARIKPGQIESYQPQAKDGTEIFMQSGLRLFTTLTYDEFDGALTSYVKCLKDNPGKFGNLAVTPSKAKPDVIALKPEPSKLIIP